MGFRIIFIILFSLLFGNLGNKRTATQITKIVQLWGWTSSRNFPNKNTFYPRTIGTHINIWTYIGVVLDRSEKARPSRAAAAVQDLEEKRPNKNTTDEDDVRLAKLLGVVPPIRPRLFRFWFTVSNAKKNRNEIISEECLPGLWGNKKVPKHPMIGTPIFLVSGDESEGPSKRKKFLVRFKGSLFKGKKNFEKGTTKKFWIGGNGSEKRPPGIRYIFWTRKRER